MKTIREATETSWWVGRRVECRTCKCVVELEQVDHNHANAMERDANMFGLVCGTCGTRNTIYENDTETQERLRDKS